MLCSPSCYLTVSTTCLSNSPSLALLSYRLLWPSPVCFPCLCQTDASSHFPSFLHNKNLPLIIACSCWRFLYCVPSHTLSLLLPCAEHAWAVPHGLWISRQPLGRIGLGWPLNSFFSATGKLLLLESPNLALWKYF